jgi:hypothetical protein
MASRRLVLPLPRSTASNITLVAELGANYLLPQSVPPLYDALLRIWKWIDKEVQIQSDPTALPKAIGKRYPWWEHLVAKVLDEEEETLCLT